MQIKKFDFVQMLHRVGAAFATTLPLGLQSEGSDEILASRDGFPEGDVSSLSIALYQMGLCKHLPEAATPPVALPTV